MRVLNVGGGSRNLPPQYAGWDQCLLDIDPAVQPDILCDAKELIGHEAGQYDAVLCSHTLEHFYQHDVPTVLAGFLHVLKPDGYAEVIVPNLSNMIESMRKNSLDINDVWYRAGGQPITFHDVLYGWSIAMKSGNLFFAHKCGFTVMSLAAALGAAGFGTVKIGDDGPNIIATAHKLEGAQPCR